MRFVRRLATGLTVLAVAWLPAAPAQAHPVQSGLDPTNWRSNVTSVPVGITVTLGDTAQRVTLTLDGARQVTVLGYAGEPFLRMTPQGVAENQRSSTTWAVTSPRRIPPADVDDHAAPRWWQVSASPSWTWHDLRTHWAGYALPPPVQQHPDRAQVVQPWDVPLLVDGRPALVTGRLEWVPASTSPPVAVLAVIALVVATAAGVVRRWRSATVAAVAVLTVLDVVHCVGMAAGRTGSAWTRMQALPGGPVITAGLWASLVVMLAFLVRRRHLTAALYGLAMVTAIIFLADAIPSLPLLWRSQGITAYAVTTARWIVAALTGTSAGLLVASILLIRRLDRRGVAPQLHPSRS